MKYRLKSPVNRIEGKVNLPISKSIMNRYLTMKYLAGGSIKEEDNFPGDVEKYVSLLNNRSGEVDINDAGTAMRFGTALFSMLDGERILKGSDRMHERPIHILVDALRKLGAQITYLNVEGYPPLKIKGGKLKGGQIEIPADVSSQYISAILMIAPYCAETLEIKMKGIKVSYPYIKMTIDLMNQMGVEVTESENVLTINPTSYFDRNLSIELDWSAASFIYQVCALSESSEIELPALTIDSLQGDKKLIELFEKFGVTTVAGKEAVVIRKEKTNQEDIEINFTEMPDLVQPILLTSLALNRRLKLKGLYNLHLKETDRLLALQKTVAKLGGNLVLTKDEAELFPGLIPKSAEFEVFNDHRMAMSLVPISLVMDEVIIDNPQVVNKSFPNFWQEMEALKFRLTEFP